MSLIASIALASFALTPSAGQLEPVEVVTHFKEAFAQRKSDSPTATPDPAIQKCMSILANHARANLRMATADENAIAQLLKPFFDAVPSEDSFPTSFFSFDVYVTDQGDRHAVGVRMGAASRLFLWHGVKPVPAPAGTSWSFPFHSHPQYAKDGTLLLNRIEVRDMGMRYGYKVNAFKQTDKGLSSTFESAGQWVLGEEDADTHFVVDGSTLTLRTIDDPKAMFTSMSDPLFPRVSLFKVAGGAASQVSTVEEMPMARALDAWMARTQRATKVDKTQLAFIKTFGREKLFLSAVVENDNGDGTGTVEASMEDTFVFTMAKTRGVWLVRGMAKK